LTVIEPYVNNEIVSQAIEITSEIMVVIEGIQNDPSQITDQVENIISSLENVRQTFVDVSESLSLGIDFPLPKTTVTTKDLEIAIAELKEAIDEMK
jgi:hypothetical protein